MSGLVGRGSRRALTKAPNELNEMNIERVIFPVLAFSVLAGCYDLDTDYFPTEKPDRAVIEGTYQLDDSSAGAVKEAGYEKVDATLRILGDGTFTVTDVPDWWNRFGNHHEGYDSGRGAWNLSEEQGTWRLRLDFESRREFHSTPAEDGLSTSITISGKHPPFVLWFYIGDPDSGRVMVFERQPISLSPFRTLVRAPQERRPTSC